MAKSRNILSPKRPRSDSVISDDIVIEYTPIPTRKKPRIPKPLPESTALVSAISNSDSDIGTIKTSAKNFAAGRGSKDISKPLMKEAHLQARTEDGSSSEESDVDFDDFDTEGLTKEELKLWSQSAPKDQRLTKSYDGNDLELACESLGGQALDITKRLAQLVPFYLENFDTEGMTKEELILWSQSAPKDQWLTNTYDSPNLRLAHESLKDQTLAIKKPLAPAKRRYLIPASTQSDKKAAFQTARHGVTIAESARRSAIASNNAQEEVARKVKKDKKNRKSDRRPDLAVTHSRVCQPTEEGTDSFNRRAPEVSDKAQGLSEASHSHVPKDAPLLPTKAVRAKADLTEERSAEPKKRKKQKHLEKGRFQCPSYDAVNPKINQALPNVDGISQEIIKNQSNTATTQDKPRKREKAAPGLTVDPPRSQGNEDKQNKVTSPNGLHSESVQSYGYPATSEIVPPKKLRVRERNHNQEAFQTLPLSKYHNQSSGHNKARIKEDDHESDNKKVRIKERLEKAQSNAGRALASEEVDNIHGIQSGF